MVDRRKAEPVRLIDGRIGGNHRHDSTGERFEDSGPVVLVADLVGDYHDSSLALLIRDHDGPAGHINGTKGRFDHHNRRIDSFRFQASERADASFEVCDDRGGLVAH